MATLTTNLKTLSNVIGVSGDEGAVRKLVIAAIRDHVDEVRVDTIGNVLAIKKASGRSKLRVMVPVGSPIMVYWILPMVSEESCQALWVKWVSVDTE